MPQLRIRITGTEDDLRAFANLLTSLDGVEHVEETADLMPQMDDPDSSSAGLAELSQAPGNHLLEVDTGNDATAARVRRLAEELAVRREVLVEFEDADGQ